MTLQLSHIFFTDALTFIIALPSRDAGALLRKSRTQETVSLTLVVAACNLLSLLSAVFKQCENLRAFLSDCDRVLEMRGRLPVHRYYSPSIRKHLNIVATEIDHRLDCYNPSLAQYRPRARAPVVRHLRLFVHRAAYPVAAIVSYDRV